MTNYLTPTAKNNLKDTRTEYIRKLIERHELIREALHSRGEAFVVNQETLESYTLHSIDGAVSLDEHGKVGDYGLLRRAETLVIEEGCCHTGDARERTEGLPCPLNLIDYNFIDAQNAERCGCCYCGSIFEGSKVTRRTLDGRADIRGTAFCPVCNMLTVIVEKGDIKVTENNLWRWFRDMFGVIDLPQYENERA